MSKKRVFIKNDDDTELSDTDSFYERRAVRRSPFYPANVPNNDKASQPGIMWVINKLFGPVVGNPVAESADMPLGLFDRWLLYRQAPTAEIRRELADELNIVRLTLRDERGTTRHTTIPMNMLDTALRGGDHAPTSDVFQWVHFHKRILERALLEYRGLFRVEDNVIPRLVTPDNRPVFLKVSIANNNGNVTTQLL